MAKWTAIVGDHIWRPHFRRFVWFPDHEKLETSNWWLVSWMYQQQTSLWIYFLWIIILVNFNPWLLKLLKTPIRHYCKTPAGFTCSRLFRMRSWLAQTNYQLSIKDRSSTWAVSSFWWCAARLLVCSWRSSSDRWLFRTVSPSSFTWTNISRKLQEIVEVRFCHDQVTAWTYRYWRWSRRSWTIS